jgi:hypothetical protein
LRRLLGMGDGKSEAAKPDWLCRFCKDGKDGKYKNFGHRTTCNVCKIDKSKSYLKAAERGTRSPTTSLAERQAARYKGASKDQQRIKKLEAQLLVAQKQARPWGVPAGGGNEEEPADSSKGPTLDQLLKVKAAWDSCGEPGKEESDKLATQIAGLKEAAMATKPGHVQIKQADRRVEKAKAACGKHTARSAELQAAMVDLQKSMAEFAAVKIREIQELMDAETAYGIAVRALNESPAPPEEPMATVPTAVEFGTRCLAMSDDFFTSTGTTRAQAKVFLDAVAAAEKVDAQAKLDAKAAATTAAAAGEEAARLEAANTPVYDSADDDDAFMSDVNAGLDGEILDPTIKRAIQAAQEVAKRRKLLKKE